jgi:hypothetical protein
MRTLFTSFTARDIRSPVRWPAKYDCGMRCRCANSSPRRRYSISRAALNSTLRDANESAANTTETVTRYSAAGVTACSGSGFPISATTSRTASGTIWKTTA